MTDQEFKRRWAQSQAKLLQYVKRPAHVVIANTARAWFRENYMAEQWYTGSGWQRWKKPKRYDPRGSAKQAYGTLMSSRDHLFRNVLAQGFDDHALIYNRVPYAKIHNEGGDIKQSIRITPQMRKWAWAMYYKNGGGNQRGSLKGKGAKAQLQTLMSGVTSNPLADKYKALALTKKTVINRTIHMPKRPFIYKNDELARVLRERLKADMKRIMGFTK